MPIPLVAATVTGLLLVLVVLWDAFETILLPRRIGRGLRLTTVYYRLTWRVWRELARPIQAPWRREGLVAAFAPLSILLLLAWWALGLIVGFALLQHAAGSVPAPEHRVWTLLYMSGETFFTLGYGDVTPHTGFGKVLAVIESGLGFAFLGTVVGYLPTMYGAFSRREIDITLMDSRAGSPPTAAEFLRRWPVPHDRRALSDRLRDWESWSGQLLESTISYPLLAYYRSQHSNQSWLGSLTFVLDCSALLLAIEEDPPPQVSHTFATARHALVDVTQIFVPRFAPGARDRLPATELERLRVHLADTPFRPPDGERFRERLAELRRLYEPYAQALAGYLLLELPPWIHGRPRKDNWSSGPWDHELGTTQSTPLRYDEHF